MYNLKAGVSNTRKDLATKITLFMSIELRIRTCYQSKPQILVVYYLNSVIA